MYSKLRGSIQHILVYISHMIKWSVTSARDILICDESAYLYLCLLIGWLNVAVYWLVKIVRVMEDTNIVRLLED